MKYAILRYKEHDTETGVITCFQYLTEDIEFWSKDAIDQIGLKIKMFSDFDKACEFYANHATDLYKPEFTYIVREYIEVKVKNESEVTK